MAIKIALVEDNPSLRSRFIQNFQFFDELDLMLVACSGEEFLEKIALLAPGQLPQVVLMDIELPGISGIETTAQFKQTNNETDVMMLTVFEHVEKIYSSLKAGAVGYLLKDESATTIVKAIEELIAGGAPMSPSIARKLITSMQQPPVAGHSESANQIDAAEFNISERELDIIKAIVAGKDFNQIADSLFISPHTVKTHIKNIYKKLHVNSRASAVRVAMEHKLI